MSETTTYAVPAVAALPPSLWGLGWTAVAVQVLALAEHGPQEASSWAGSILLGVVLVPLVVHGVVRARSIRFWLVVVLLALGTLVDVVDLVTDPSAWELAHAALGVAQLALLRAYRGTDWFAWQRTRPAIGPSIVPVLVLAALVGALGGLIGTTGSEAVSTTVHVGV